MWERTEVNDSKVGLHVLSTTYISKQEITRWKHRATQI